MLRRIFGGLRGYAGNVSPAAALDATSSDGNTYLLDIRTARRAPFIPLVSASWQWNCYEPAEGDRDQKPQTLVLLGHLWEGEEEEECLFIYYLSIY